MASYLHQNTAVSGYADWDSYWALGVSYDFEVCKLTLRQENFAHGLLIKSAFTCQPSMREVENHFHKVVIETFGHLVTLSHSCNRQAEFHLAGTAEIPTMNNPYRRRMIVDRKVFVRNVLVTVTIESWQYYSAALTGFGRILFKPQVVAVLSQFISDDRITRDVKNRRGHGQAPQ